MRHEEVTFKMATTSNHAGSEAVKRSSLNVLTASLRIPIKTKKKEGGGKKSGSESEAVFTSCR